MKAKFKKIRENESSISAYCFIMALYSFTNSGLSYIFWIYFLLMVILSTIYCYRIYKSDQENKTYTFFQVDSLTTSLFLLTIYFDLHFNFIGFQMNLLSKYFLVLGLILLIPSVIRLFMNRRSL